MPPAAGPRAGLALFKSMQSVPQSVHNSLVSLKALDEKFSAAHERYEQNALAHLSKAQADSDGLRRLRSEQRALLLLADQKLQVATDAHALVERQLRRLDQEFTRYEESMRGHGPEPAPRRKPGEAAAAAASAEAEAWAAADLAGTTYCTCSRPSFGEMVCCDNPECAIEWFHYDCVGLDAAPDGVWLCPICAVAEPHLAMQLASGDARASARGSRGGRSGGRGRGSRGGGRGGGGSGSGGARGRGGGGGRGAAMSKAGRGRGAPIVRVPNGKPKVSKALLARGRGKTAVNIFKKGLTSPAQCPACRGKHKAHTCGRGRSAVLL